MYLEEQNSDLNDEINDLICLSNDLTSIEDRLAVKLKAWSLTANLSSILVKSFDKYRR